MAQLALASDRRIDFQLQGLARLRSHPSQMLHGYGRLNVIHGGSKRLQRETFAIRASDTATGMAGKSIVHLL